MKTAGRFSLDEAGTLRGPKAYMDEQGNDKLDSILAGKDLGWDALVAHCPHNDFELLILVALQTDYAGWAGMQQMLAALA